MSEKTRLSELHLAVVGELTNIFVHYHTCLGTQSHPLWRELFIVRVRVRKERYHVSFAGKVASPSLAENGRPHPELAFTGAIEFGRTSFRSPALTPIEAVIRVPEVKPFRILWSTFGEGADYRGGRSRMSGSGSYTPRVYHLCRVA